MIQNAIEAWEKIGLNIVVIERTKNLSSSLQLKLPPHAKSLILLASGGSTFWNFVPEKEKVKDPIDTFITHQVLTFGLEVLRENLKDKILYPHTSEHFPLQQLGRELNLCRQSLLGIDIHSEFGLWFAFRAAFVSDQDLALTGYKHVIERSPCDHCQKRPCERTELSFNERRLSCPVGSAHRYSDEQIQYHSMAAQQRL